MVHLKHVRYETMRIGLPFLIGGVVLFGLGYLGRSLHDGLISKPQPAAMVSPKSSRIYEVAETRSLRASLDGTTITVIGAVYAAPGQQYFLIPDDDLSMRPDKLPPESAIDYGIQLPEWRFRDLAVGTIYCGIAVTGRFEIGDSPTAPAIAPIDSLSWNETRTKTQKSESGRVRK